MKLTAEHVGPVSPAVIMGPFGGITCHEDGTLRSQSRIEQDLLARDKYAGAWWCRLAAGRGHGPSVFQVAMTWSWRWWRIMAAV